MKNKNIVEVCLSNSLGGLELSTANCFNYFKDKTNCSIVVAPDTKLDKLINDKNKFTIKQNKLLPFLPALKLAKFIDDKDIDVIHFHLGKDIIFVVLAKLLSKKKPKIIYSRHMNMTRFKDDVYHRWLYKNINILHAVSKQVKEQLGKYIPSSIRPSMKIIYLGVKEPQSDLQKVKDLRAKYNIEDAFVVGIIGKISEYKGQHILIDAISKLDNPNIKALIVGNYLHEEYMKKLRSMVKSLNIEDRVIFAEFTKDVNEHMKLCDATVLATKNETFGLVVIESMRNKVCTIATNSGGPLEIIDDNINGLLFDRTSDDLASKIEYLYNNSDIKNSLAQNGYEKVKKEFDYDTQMQKLYDVIMQS
jgi:glycosyltransferase involved in cell wall biosynthesis